VPDVEGFVVGVGGAVTTEVVGDTHVVADPLFVARTRPDMNFPTWRDSISNLFEARLLVEK
jgi:hypothetical protein